MDLTALNNSEDMIKKLVKIVEGFRSLHTLVHDCACSNRSTDSVVRGSMVDS